MAFGRPKNPYSVECLSPHVGACAVRAGMPQGSLPAERRSWHTFPGGVTEGALLETLKLARTKPCSTAPLTSINVGGNWVCDITTGGTDESATQITAYLIPNGYHPPLMSGGGALPAELDANAVAKADIRR